MQLGDPIQNCVVGYRDLKGANVCFDWGRAWLRFRRVRVRRRGCAGGRCECECLIVELRDGQPRGVDFYIAERLQRQLLSISSKVMNKPLTPNPVSRTRRVRLSGLGGMDSGLTAGMVVVAT